MSRIGSKKSASKHTIRFPKLAWKHVLLIAVVVIVLTGVITGLVLKYDRHVQHHPKEHIYHHEGYRPQGGGEKIDAIESARSTPTPSPTPTPVPGLSPGTAIKCQQDQGTSNAASVYQYNQGKRYWLQNPQIADSCVSNWNVAPNPVMVDCSDIPQGPNQAVNCNPAAPAGGFTPITG